MNKSADLNELMNHFRLASRELFNHFFRVSNPYGNEEHAWLQEERYRNVQSTLFQELVAKPMSLGTTEYGNPQPNVLVKLRNDGAVPMLLNREVNSGYWDYPVNEVEHATRLLFVSYFDWDQLDYRDNKYVRVQVDQWPARPEIVGKHGLIESHYVKLAKI